MAYFTEFCLRFIPVCLVFKGFHKNSITLRYRPFIIVDVHQPTRSPLNAIHYIEQTLGR